MNTKKINQKSRERSPKLNIHERKAMIVKAALTLLVEVGPGFTTHQLARAAGISEPTIFRAFANKDEVLLACLEEATKPYSIAFTPF